MPRPHPLPYTVIALGTIATVGLWGGSKGVVLPHLIADLSISPAAGAAILSADAVGYFASSFGFGLLTQRFGLKRVAAAGIVLAGVMLALFLTLRVPPLLYAAGVVYGAGVSLLELSTSLTISLLYDDQRQGGMLNLLHGFFGVGALAGSLWGAFWIGLGAGWRTPLGLAGALMVLWAGAFLTRPTLKLPRPEAGGGGFGRMFRDPLVWAASLALAAAVAAEAGIALWLPSFLQQAKGLSEAASAFFTTVFFLGFTATRLAASWLVHRVGAIRLLVVLAAAGGAGMVGLLALPGRWAWLAALAGAGVAVGFATCVALVAARYPDRVNKVYSLMYSAGGIAGILIGPFMGWVGQKAGLAAGMSVPAAAYLVLAVLMSYYGWRVSTEVAS